MKYSMCQHLSDTSLSALGVAKSCSKARKPETRELSWKLGLQTRFFSIFFFCPGFGLGLLFVRLSVGSSAQRLLIINLINQVECFQYEAEIFHISFLEKTSAEILWKLIGWMFCHMIGFNVSCCDASEKGDGNGRNCEIRPIQKRRYVGAFFV